MRDYLLETKLKHEAPELHERVRSSVMALENMLQSFLTVFPDFTDHSILHSMDVLEFCNQLIGAEQVKRLGPEECYVLIMACYLHDIGMGVREKEYDEFCERLELASWLETHPSDERADVIRKFHHEFSGQFIRKYAELFDIPTEELLYAIVQVSRGHRVTDLYDETEYPDIRTRDGVIHTSYLAAVVRLADEIDVASERNPELLYDTSRLTKQKDVEAFGTHESIKRVEVAEDRIILHVKPKAPEYEKLIEELAVKIRETLDYCRGVAAARSEFRITQECVTILNDPTGGDL